MATTANRIILAGADGVRFEEYIAGASLYPGHLIELYNAAGTGKVRKNSDEGGFCERLFAIENALEGLTPGVAATEGITITTAYSSTERVFCAACKPGTVVYAYLKAGVSYAIGDKLTSGGDGTLIKTSSLSTTTELQDVVGVLTEALDLSATGAVDTRGIVRLI
jgi:hypothetical protein